MMQVVANDYPSFLADLNMQELEANYVLEISPDTVSSFLRNKKYAVLGFYNTRWCSVSQLHLSYLEKLSENYKGSLAVGKMFFDGENEKFARNEYNVSAIPATLIFKNGVEMHRIIGLMDETEFSDEVEKGIFSGLLYLIR